MVDITGRKDARSIRNRYQHEVNEAHGRVKRKVDWLYKMNRKLKGAIYDIERLQKDIIANEEERADLYTSLQNLLEKETNFEMKMWDKTQEGRKVKSITIKQKFKDSEIEEARYDAMMDYLKQYPEYASKSSFSSILNKISDIEKGIKQTKKAFNEAVSRANTEIAYFPRNLMEAKNNIKTYKKVLDEGEEKLKSMRYSGSFFHKISSETKKLDVTIDTINHKIGEYEDTINKIEEEVNTAKEEISKMK
jgi:hypothetical protein